MTAAARPVDVAVDGRVVRLSSLDRVLWPRAGWRKVDLVDYYTRVAPALLPHVAGRPVTLRRFPEGIEGPSFFQTRCPPHPPWVRPVTVTFERSGKVVDIAVVDDLPSIVWAANLATIEFHPYLGRADALAEPLVAVFDLDPGAPAGLVDACHIGVALRELLDEAGLRSWPKTSGLKGLHVYVPLNSGAAYDGTKAFARGLASRLVAAAPERVVHRMTKDLRRGKVLVDWSQNDFGKSTVAPYSLRAAPVPLVSMPVTWDEVERVAETGDARPLLFQPDDTFRRLDQHGDLFAPVLTTVQRLPSI